MSKQQTILIHRITHYAHCFEFYSVHKQGQEVTRAKIVSWINIWHPSVYCATPWIPMIICFAAADLILMWVNLNLYMDK